MSVLEVHFAFTQIVMDFYLIAVKFLYCIFELYFNTRVVQKTVVFFKGKHVFYFFSETAAWFSFIVKQIVF